MKNAQKAIDQAKELNMSDFENFSKIRKSLHDSWLYDFEQYAWSYMKEKTGSKKCTGIIFKLVYKDETVEEYLNSTEEDLEPKTEIIATLPLPHASSSLIHEMARFTKSSVWGSPVFDGLNSAQNNSAKDNVFCFNTLLNASYPKNAKTGVFRGNDGPSMLFEVRDDEVHLNQAPYCAFAGLGVMFYNAFKMAVDPESKLTDEELVMEKTNEVFIGIIEGKFEH